MARLYCAPLGESARDIFCEELKSLPHGILVLPNSKLKEEVLRQYGVKSVGLDKLASKILNLNGFSSYKEINRRTQEIIVEELIHKALEAGHLQHFAKLAEKKGFVSSVTSLIGQLSRSGATSEELDFAMEAWDRQAALGMKDKEITHLYDAYCRELEQHQWYDLEGKYKLALEALSKDNPIVPWSHIFFSDFYTLDALQHSFIYALAQHCEIKIGITYEKNREDIFKAVATTYGSLVGYLGVEQSLERAATASAMNRALMEGLWRDTALSARPATSSVHTISFRSRDEEMRWVLTEVKALLKGNSSLFGDAKAKAAAENIVLVVRDFTNYAGLRKLADEYGLPISLPKTAALSSEPLTSFIQLLLQAVEGSNQGVQAYFKMLASPLGRLLFKVDGEKISKLQQEKYFNSPTEVQDRIKFEQEQGYYPEDQLLTLVDQFIAAVPYRAELDSYVELILDLLKKLQLEQFFGRMYKDSVQNQCSCCITIEQLQEMLLTKQALVNALTCLAGDYASCGKNGYTCNLREWRQLFNEALKGVNIVLAAGRQDGVLVTEAVNMQGLKRDYVFMLGMREGEFPSGKTENWLYDDSEREILGKKYKRRENKVYNDQERGELLSLGIEMPNTAAAYAEDAFFFASTVAAAEKGLVLTWFEDDENGVSRYVETVQKVFSNVKTEKPLSKNPASVNELYCLGRSCDEGWLKEQVGQVTIEAAEVDVWRHQYSAAWSKNKAIQRKQELMAAGELPTDTHIGQLTAEETALLNEVGRYNGVLSADMRSFLSKRVGNSFSPSALETFAACPFMYLGKRVWRQDEGEDKDDMPNKIDEGNLYHKVMERFINCYLKKKLTNLPQEEQENLSKRLEKIFEAVCSEYLNSGAIIDNEVWQAEKPRMLRVLQKWLDFELLDQAYMPTMTPAATEWEFEIAPEELKYEGRRVYLKGKIDRIDTSEDKALVTDYKRSKGSVPGISKLDSGEDMQMPIYMLAVEASFEGGKKLLGDTYYVILNGTRASVFTFETSGNPLLKCKKHNQTWESFKERSLAYLKQYISSIYSGDFNVLKQKKCSDYCSLADICRFKEIEQLGKEGDE